MLYSKLLIINPLASIYPLGMHLLQKAGQEKETKNSWYSQVLNFIVTEKKILWNIASLQPPASWILPWLISDTILWGYWVCVEEPVISKIYTSKAKIPLCFEILVLYKLSNFFSPTFLIYIDNRLFTLEKWGCSTQRK